jgi:hypothetical protein
MVKSNAFTGGVVEELQTVNDVGVGSASTNLYAAVDAVTVGSRGTSLIGNNVSYSSNAYNWLGNNIYFDAAGVLRASTGSAVAYYHQNLNLHYWYGEAAGATDRAVTTIPNMTLDTSGNLTVVGALAKGSGSFKIDHPLKPDTHYLVHSFTESPQADLYYRGRIALVNGQATVNIDAVTGMTEGTFEALCGDVQCLTSNETAFNQVRGTLVGNILTIECETASADTVSWLVIGERKDQHMLDTNWTDENGHVIVEPLKPESDAA